MTLDLQPTYRPGRAVLALTLLLSLVALASCRVSEETARSVDSPDGSLADLVPEYGASLEEWGQAHQQAGNTDPVAVDEATTNRDTDGAFPAIDWEDLIAPGFSSAEIAARYRDRLDAAEPGSAEAAAVYEEMQAEFDPESVNPDLDGSPVRLSGFVAPLTFDDGRVTEFLLVPTFGACIHVPPPPPNQTVVVTVAKEHAVTVEQAWGPVWVEGTIAIDAAVTDLASASYRIDKATSGVYDDF